MAPDRTHCCNQHPSPSSWREPGPTDPSYRGPVPEAQVAVLLPCSLGPGVLDLVLAANAKPTYPTLPNTRQPKHKRLNNLLLHQP